MPLRSDMTRVHATAVATKPRSLHAFKRALLVLFVGLLLTGSVTWWRHTVDEQIASDRLRERGQLLTFETKDLLDRVGMHLTAAAGLFQASEHVTDAEFHVFVDDVGLMPGLQGIGYVQIVADGQLGDWLIQARARVPELTLYEDSPGTSRPAVRGALLRIRRRRIQHGCRARHRLRCPAHEGIADKPRHAADRDDGSSRRLEASFR